MSYVSVLLPILIVAVVFYFIFRSRRRVKALMQQGTPAVALVLECNQTGTVINGVPRMRLRLQLEQAGVPIREIVLTQLIGFGNMPRVGEQVLVMVDPKDPAKAAYGGLASALGVSTGSPQKGDLTGTQTQDLLALAPGLRTGGKLGVGTILAIDQSGVAARVTIEVDSVVEPKYTVTTEQVMTGFDYQVGDRAYLFVDKTDRNSVALMPLSMSGGKKLIKGANRLDPLVLDPQLQKAGRKGTGTVLSCERMPLANAVLEARGMQKWHLRLNITPEDGTQAYDADQTVTFTTPEKVARICVVGATVPVRYDANDPMTFSTDTIAMGYPDPYEAVWAAFGQTPMPSGM